MQYAKTSKWDLWSKTLCNLNESTEHVYGQISTPTIAILISYFVEKATWQGYNLQFLYPQQPGDVVIALDEIGQTPKRYLIIERTDNPFEWDISATTDTSRIGTVGNQSSSQGKRLRSQSRFEQCLCCGKALPPGSYLR